MKISEYYHKFVVLNLFNYFYIYITRMQLGVGVGYDTDKIPNKKHYRLNIFLIRNNCEFWIDFKPNNKRIVFFRPDIQHYSFFVAGEKAKALILSIGFAF